MQRRSQVVVGVAVTTVAAALLTVWSLSWCTKPATSPYYQPSALRAQYTRWPAFTSTGKHSKEWYVEHCFGGKFSEDTEDVFFQAIPRWSRATDEDCVDVYQQFDTLFEVHHRYTPKLTFPPAFAERVKVWLGGDPTLLHRVHHQHIIHVFQPLTGEHCVYNPVRSKRPGPLVRVDLHAWVDRQARKTRASCDFCNLKNMTASDILGRHPTKRTMRVSNIFKVERWHSLVVTRYQHHPLNFTLDTFIAFFQDALTYINQVTEMEEQYIYPNLAWDTLYEAGASQLHPHIHMMVTPDHYYGFYEHLRTAGQRYFDATGRNYFTTLLEVHQALGLTVHYGTAVAIPTMAGKADMEVMFLSEAPNEDLYRLIFYTIAAYHDTYTQLCKGFSAAYPAEGLSEAARVGRIPVIARLISRGECTSPKTDYSSYEIFQMVERYHDPWEVARAIRKAIKKHRKA
nr:uncharacterized protein LOC123768103 [Procambarus clarkii]